MFACSPKSGSLKARRWLPPRVFSALTLLAHTDVRSVALDQSIGANSTEEANSELGAEYQLYAHDMLPFSNRVYFASLYEIPFFLL